MKSPKTSTNRPTVCGDGRWISVFEKERFDRRVRNGVWQEKEEKGSGWNGVKIGPVWDDFMVLNMAKDLDFVFPSSRAVG